ncbi:DNA mismatch repair protein Msh6-like [Haliotis rufescens]|uniref:DNA mismatch repair protein Msh6-like n=1 Tax=Haliotis rufescens TaxID=6454 RepID=UPI001EB014B9|nr:DNA mismatch repair protein Msh6-like [Haliotis rufescens]
MSVKQSNLFSFFSKTPNKVPNNETPKKDVLSPRRSPNSGKRKTPTTNGNRNVTDTDPEFELGAVVWAKLEGYPWWPSLVCNHPTQKKHVKGGKQVQLHVQFFDDPPSRAWIRAKYVKAYKGSGDKAFQRGGQFHCHDAECYEGALKADAAMKMSVEERLSTLIVDLQPSDSEDSAEEAAELIDLDPDIFDAEMQDDEADNSKENHNDSIKTDDSKISPRKTPSKKCRPSRSSQKHKRRRIMLSTSGDEESGDEFKPDSGSSDEDDSGSSGEDEDNVSGPETESDAESPVKDRKRKRPSSTPKPKSSSQPSIADRFAGSMLSAERRHSFKPAVSDKTKSKLASFNAPEQVVTDTPDIQGDFPHVKLDFLQPDKIRDIKGRKQNTDDYDPRTVMVPDTFMKKQTPAMRQWWELKAHHYDTILFFKMGKFYELFHMDAVIGVSELGLIYMKGEHAHSGFPEIAYTRYADSLIQKGYKVARVEQTETPDMMSERCKHMSRTATKFDKVVKREVCQVTSRGTKTYRHVEGDCSDVDSNYLLAISEKEAGSDGGSMYGVCFIDTSVGIFHLGQFTDDRHGSRLRTVIAHHTPSLVLYERGKMSAKTMQLINTNLSSALKESLASGTEFWDSSKTLKTLAEEDYFKMDGELFEWPGDLKGMMSESDSLGLTAADEFDLAVHSLGAVTWYLQYSLLDQELLSMRKFVQYRPVDSAPTVKKTAAQFSQKHMVLDGVTLLNLDLVENCMTGTTEGTLLERLDQCCTPFGKRLFRQWLCAPLCSPAAINDRLDAVEDLMASQDLLVDMVEVMKKLPDLERLLSRIHTLGSACRSRNHPDSRAILYEEVTYSKRKIEDFLATLGGFKSAFQMAQKLQTHTSNFKSTLLKKTISICCSQADQGHFPDISEDLAFFDAAFDHTKARKDGTILPSKGVNLDYDQASQDIKAIEKRLVQYLDKQRDRLSCMAMVYWGTAKNRYQMEIPEVAWKRVPNEYEVMSSKKGWKRYRTPDIEDMLADLTEAEDRKDTALKDTMRRVFSSFDERHKKWRDVLDCLSVLDVIISLAEYSRCGDGVTCRPELVDLGQNVEPFLELRDARHPCIARTFTGGDFIPNDTVIGVDDETDEGGVYSNSRIVLVTGPNMGGKSTLMRQVGLITIMAQLGCYVPAEKCRLTPVDRVFTRLGASDRIMAGESTFFVELSETSAILQHASKHSLVLMDELGRGTATYDGTAIACSVVQELSKGVNCRTLFSTHYHSLVEEFSHDANVRLGHMACMVENENEEDPSQETITFLYKFIKGACPKSYGFNAARLADIPEEVIKAAVGKAKEFEESFNRLKVLKSLWWDCTAECVRAMQQLH